MASYTKPQIRIKMRTSFQGPYILGRADASIGGAQLLGVTDVSGLIASSGQVALPNGPGSNIAAADGTIVSNISGATALPVSNSLSTVFDHDIGSTTGIFPVRGSTTWGTSGNWTLTGTNPYLLKGASPSQIQVIGIDGAVTALLTGVSKGIRTFSNSTGSNIEGVDQTGIGSFQPLAIGGSEVDFTLAGVQKGSLTATSGFQILGTTTNDNAAAGQIGEFVSSDVVFPGASITTGTQTNVTSISLTAGDWEVEGVVGYHPQPTTTITGLLAAVSNVSATFPSLEFRTQLQLTFATGLDQTIAAPRQRFSLSTTTTIYLVAFTNFGTSTMQAFGQINARRQR